MQGSLRCLSGRGAGGIVRRQARYSLPSLETQWLRSLARPARVERRQPRQGCKQCRALSEAQSTQLDVRRLPLVSCTCSVLKQGLYVTAVTGQGGARRVLEQALALMARSSDALPFATVLSAALALCGPPQCQQCCDANTTWDYLTKGVCAQVVAGLLCLVCPVHVLPRRQSAACLPFHNTWLQSMIPVTLRRFTPAMYAPGLGFLMLAVGINLRLECFREVFKRPKVRRGAPA